MNEEENVYQTVYGVKIYPIDYLANEELTDTDLNNLLNKNSKSMLYSFIIGMFKHMGIQKKNHQIIKTICNEDNWMNSFKWNNKQRKEYEDKIVNAYKNVYQYGNDLERSYAEWFSIIYGFQLKKK